MCLSHWNYEPHWRKRVISCKNGSPCWDISTSGSAHWRYRRATQFKIAAKPQAIRQYNRVKSSAKARYNRNRAKSVADGAVRAPEEKQRAYSCVQLRSPLGAAQFPARADTNPTATGAYSPLQPAHGRPWAYSHNDRKCTPHHRDWTRSITQQRVRWPSDAAHRQQARPKELYSVIASLSDQM